MPTLLDRGKNDSDDGVFDEFPRAGDGASSRVIFFARSDLARVAAVSMSARAVLRNEDAVRWNSMVVHRSAKSVQRNADVVQRNANVVPRNVQACSSERVSRSAEHTWSFRGTGMLFVGTQSSLM
jgi:hypothetical protein